MSMIQQATKSETEKMNDNLRSIYGTLDSLSRTTRVMRNQLPQHKKGKSYSYRSTIESVLLPRNPLLLNQIWGHHPVPYLTAMMNDVHIH